MKPKAGRGVPNTIQFTTCHHRPPHDLAARSARTDGTHSRLGASIDLGLSRSSRHCVVPLGTEAGWSLAREMNRSPRRSENRPHS